MCGTSENDVRLVLLWFLWTSTADARENPELNNRCCLTEDTVDTVVWKESPALELCLITLEFIVAVTSSRNRLADVPQP